VVAADGLVQQLIIGEAVASGGYVVLVADEQMRFVATSDGACALLGYTREEVAELTIPDIVVDRQEAESLYSEFLRDGMQRGEITLRRKDGMRVSATYEASATTVAGRTYYVSVLFRK
jgi:two-component system sensor histidine kinase/response regulator